MPKRLTSASRKANKISDKKLRKRKGSKHTYKGGEIHRYNQDSYGRYRGDYGDSNIVGSYKPELPYQVATNYLDGKYAIFNETLADPFNHTGAQIGSKVSVVDVTNGVNLTKRDSFPVYNPVTNLSTQGKIFNTTPLSEFHYGTHIPGFDSAIFGGSKKKKRKHSKKVSKRKN